MNLTGIGIIRIVSGLALLAVALLAGCTGKAAPTAPQPPEVAVETVRRASVPVTTELPGRTSAFLVAQVRARVDGIVLKREFREGGDVKAGQRLYQIDPAPYRAALDSAAGALQKAQANLVAMNAQAERYQQLVAGNAVSKQDYDNAISSQGQAAADVAFGKAGVETAKINLGYTNVVSPITGRIGTSLVTQGAYVQASAATLMATIQQIDPIYVDLNQTSVVGLQLRRDVANGRVKLNGPDQVKVTLTLEDGSKYPAVGKLEFTDITVDPGTGSVTVRAVFPNPDHVLLPGMFVRASIERGMNDNALLVPQVGVTHDARGQSTTLVVGPDNKVELRTIQTTSTSGANWVVDGGLKDGERVIVSGMQRVQPGMSVRTVDAQTPAGLAAQKSAAADTSFGPGTPPAPPPVTR